MKNPIIMKVVMNELVRKEIQVKKKTNNNILLIVALFLGYTMVYIDKISVSYSLIPISEEFHFDSTEKGIIMSAFFLGYAVMQIPMGIFINKIGSKIILIGSILSISIFALLFGLSNSLIMFIMIRFLTGLIAHSGYSSSSSKEVTINFSASKRTFVQGILLSSSGIAGFIGPLLLSPIIILMGWRVSYYILSVIAIFIALFLYYSMPRRKKEVRETDKLNRQKISIIKVWSDKRVWILLLCSFFINCLLYGLSNWMPSYLTSELGLSLQNAALVSSISGLFMLIGSIGGSYVVGRFFYRKEKYVVILTSIIGASCLFSCYYISSYVYLSVLLGIASFFLILSFVTLMSIPLRIFEGELFAPSYGTLATGGIIGGFVSPILIGQLVDLSDGKYLMMFLLFLILGLLTALSILFIKHE